MPSAAMDKFSPVVHPTQPVGLSTYPDQVRRALAGATVPLNILVVGSGGLGKRTFINALFNCDFLEVKPRGPPSSLQLFTWKSKICEEAESIDVTVIETFGFGDLINNTDCFDPIVSEIERRNEEYLAAEFSADSGAAFDPRIHALVHFLPPVAGLRQVDLQLMKRVSGLVNLLPVIAKADSLTSDELRCCKESILGELGRQEIEVFNPASYGFTPTKATVEHWQLPYAMVASEEVAVVDGEQCRSRCYQWGTVSVDVDDAFHDFLLLREILIEEMLLTIIEVTDQLPYQRFRRERLDSRGIEFYRSRQKPDCRESESEVEEKREAALISMRTKIAARQKRIEENRDEILRSFQAIMSDLRAKRQQYEVRLLEMGECVLEKETSPK